MKWREGRHLSIRKRTLSIHAVAMTIFKDTGSKYLPEVSVPPRGLRYFKSISFVRHVIRDLTDVKSHVLTDPVREEANEYHRIVQWLDLERRPILSTKYAFSTVVVHARLSIVFMWRSESTAQRWCRSPRINNRVQSGRSQHCVSVFVTVPLVRNERYQNAVEMRIRCRISRAHVRIAVENVRTGTDGYWQLGLAMSKKSRRRDSSVRC